MTIYYFKSTEWSIVFGGNSEWSDMQFQTDGSRSRFSNGQF